MNKDIETMTKVKELLDVPSDEPIFIIRAQDKFSVKALQKYRMTVRDGIRLRENVTEFKSWWNEVGRYIDEFVDWQRDNRKKVKVPD